MANQEYLKILKQGVIVWNKWRIENWDVRLDFSGANLSHANLFKANLTNADLSGAYLTGADLSRAKLRGLH